MATDTTIRIGGDASGAVSAIDQVSGRTKKLTANLRKIAAVSGAAFAGLSAGIGVTIGAFKEQQKVENQLNAVIKSTGGVAGVSAQAVKELAQEIQKTSTFGDEAIISSSNLLLTFKQIGEKTFPRAQKAIADVSAAMGVGLKEATIQIGKALNDPIEGLTALRRVGITFSKGQEDQIKTMVEFGQVAQAQALILDELESQFQGSAAAQAEGLGVLDQLKNSFGDLLEVLGEQFAPIVEAVAGKLRDFIDELRNNEETVKRLAQVIGFGAAGAGLVFAFSTLALAVGPLIGVIGGLAAALFSPVGAALALAAIIGTDGLSGDLSGLGESFDNLINQIRGPLAGALTFLSDAFKIVVLEIRTIAGAIGQILQGNFTAAKDIIVRNSFQIEALVLGIGDRTLAAYADGLEKSKEKPIAVFGNLQKSIKEKMDGIKTDFDTFSGAVSGIFDAKNSTIISSEQEFGDNLLSIDQEIGDSQVDIFERTSDSLVSKAQDRSSRLLDIERRGSATRGSTKRTSGGSFTFGEGSIEKTILDAGIGGGFVIKGGSGIGNPFEVTRGRATAGGFIGQKVDVRIGFDGPEATRILTAKQNVNSSLGTR